MAEIWAGELFTLDNNNIMEKELSTFACKCLLCNHEFVRPELGDFQSYGEYVFCSRNGLVHAYGNAFSASAKLIEVLLPDVGTNDGLFRSALAELADPILGQQLTPHLYCPGCQNAEIQKLDLKTGTTWLKEVSYRNLISMKKHELIARIQKYADAYTK